jgi:putative membrane protein
MLDLILAVLHHLIVFSLVAVVFAELVIIRPGTDAAAVRRVAAIDAWHGILAGLIVFVGFGPPRGGTITRTTCTSGPRSPRSW